jgi:hypothetical protein
MAKQSFSLLCQAKQDDLLLISHRFLSTETDKHTHTTLMKTQPPDGGNNIPKLLNNKQNT